MDNGKRENKERQSPMMIINLILIFLIYGLHFLACVFLALGANVFYGTGEEFAPNSAMFVDQLVQLYASLGLGQTINTLTAFSTMFSTTLTCLDAFPKVLSKCFSLIFSIKERTPRRNNLIFLCFLLFLEL